MELTNREVATAAWTVAIFLLAMTHGGIRRSVWRVIAYGVTATKLSIPALLYWLYLLAIVWLASLVQLWDGSLLIDTAIWFVVGGLPLFSRFIEVGRTGLLRTALLRGIAYPELLAFALELADPPLLAMLVILPITGLLAICSAVAGVKPKLHSQKPWYDGALVVIGLGWLLWTAAQVVTGWASLDWPHIVRTFYLPLWLTVAAVPFVYLLGAYSRWEHRRLSAKLRERMR